MNPKFVAIVGGGISGLATAWRIRERGDQTDWIPFVFEADSRPGGCCWTLRDRGFSVEMGPNGFLDNKPDMLDLVDSLGLAGKLVRANDQSHNRYIFLGDKLRPFPRSPGEFLRSDLISWSAKFRGLCEPLLAKRATGDESIANFGRRHFGQEITNVFLDAMVTGIFAGDAELLSLPACFPRIAELEAEHRSLLKAQKVLARKRKQQAKSTGSSASPLGLLTTLENGMGTVIETLAEKLGDRLIQKAPAANLRHLSNKKWRVIGTAGQPLAGVDADGRPVVDFDAVVLSCPASVQTVLLQELDQDLSRTVGQIRSTPAVVVALGYNRADLPTNLDGFGYLTPERLGRPVLGVIWSSSVFPKQAPTGAYQFRAILGGWRWPDLLDKSDDQLIQLVRDDLLASLNVRSKPSHSWVIRWKSAIPQYHVGHLDRVRSLTERVKKWPGLYLAGNAYLGVAVNDCAREAKRVADAVVHLPLQS